MHLTHWVPERGCSCQRHLDEVDSCGCSPMVIKQRDFDEIIVVRILLVQFNPHLPSRSVHPYQLDESISKFLAAGLVYCFIFIFDRNSYKHENPDQTPCSAASDQGLHGLP